MLIKNKRLNFYIEFTVKRANHPFTPFIEYVGINHRRRHVRMAEQLLHSANVVARLQQVRGKGVTQGMRRRRLRDACTLQRSGPDRSGCGANLRDP